MDGVELELRDEVSQFHSDGDGASALLFRPCNNYLRFQIHRLVQDEFAADLKSFSVGEGKRRRLVIGWLASYREPEEGQDEEGEAVQADPVSSASKNEATPGKKRPDQQIYVPRHKRLTQQTPQQQTATAQRKPRDIMEEISARLGTETRVQESKIAFPPSSSDEIPWRVTEEAILEIHDFDASLKTGDVLKELSAFRNKFEIRWVDDTHALAVFATESAAQQALKTDFGSIRVRVLAEGTEESRERARACVNANLPAMPRPETSTLVARRMMAGALGVKMDLAGDKKEIEERRIREARLRKKENS